jgi:hypothetical protein
VSIHERIERVGLGVTALCVEKNKAYGSSFEKAGEFLRLLYPDGLRPEQYGDALLLVRIFDKQMRVATNPAAFGESPYRDIAGYGLLGAAKDEGEAPRDDAGDLVTLNCSDGRHTWCRRCRGWVQTDAAHDCTGRA